MHNQNRRAVIYSALVLIVLLLLLSDIIADNNRKYADALSTASTAINLTNQALVAPMQTATSRAVSTTLTLTQTSAVSTP